MFVGSTYCNVPPSKSKNIILGLKIKTVTATNQVVGHPTSCLDSRTAVVQHVTQLAQIDFYVLTWVNCIHFKLSGAFLYLFTLQFTAEVWDIITVGTSHIYPNIWQYTLHNSNFQVNTYSMCSALSFIILWQVHLSADEYGNISSYIWIHKHNIHSVLQADRYASLNDRDTFWAMHHKAISWLCEHVLTQT